MKLGKLKVCVCIKYFSFKSFNYTIETIYRSLKHLFWGRDVGRKLCDLHIVNLKVLRMFNWYDGILSELCPK